MRAAQKKVWIEIAESAAPGLLGNTDRLVVELTAALVVKLRKDGVSTPHGLKGGELTALITLLSKIGFSPLDRARLGVGSD